MTPDVTRATVGDVTTIAGLYRRLAVEMAALRPVWPFTDGLAEPVETTLAALVVDPDWMCWIGSIEEAPVGFLLARDEPMLPQADGSRVGAIRFIYTEPEARAVGVGEAMVTAFLEEAAARGIRRFDAHVSPGHREAKNFFESHGFKARAIVMYREDG